MPKWKGPKTVEELQALKGTTAPRRKKYTEANIPEGIRAEVRYIKGALSGQSPWVTSCHLVENVTGKVMASGTAVCSAKDQPVRKIGRAMAIGRALKKYDQSVPVLLR
ncbi:hypothetical protein LCGC14_1463310 [marine sediment metagenome]|uniref:Uncharacterized protein n=1 Tax=marine sediment metagenome TaxID=412755 RepID=A0A0F9K0F7_9ZZZZ